MRTDIPRNMQASINRLSHLANSLIFPFRFSRSYNNPSLCSQTASRAHKTIDRCPGKCAIDATFLLTDSPPNLTRAVQPFPLASNIILHTYYKSGSRYIEADPLRCDLFCERAFEWWTTQSRKWGTAMVVIIVHRDAFLVVGMGWEGVGWDGDEPVRLSCNRNDIWCRLPSFIRIDAPHT